MNEDMNLNQPEPEQMREASAAGKSTAEEVVQKLEQEKQELYSKQDDVFKRMSAYDGQLREEKKVRSLSRKKLILIIMIALIAALALAIVVPMLLPEKVEEEPQTTVSTARPYNFSSRTKPEVASVTLHQNGEDLRLEINKDGEYYAPDHTDVVLNQTSAGSVFFAFASLDAVDTVADDSSRKAEFGFENPAYSADVTYTDGQKATYYLGDRAPNGTNYYFMQEGNDKIYMVATSVNTYMKRTLLELETSVELPEINYQELANLHIENDAGTIDLQSYEKDEVAYGVGALKMNEPYRVDVDSEKYNEFMEKVSALSIKNYVGKTTDLAEYGLDEAHASHLKMTDKNGVEVDLTIGASRNSTEYYVLVGDNTEKVYTISNYIAEAVLQADALYFSESFAAIVTLSMLDAFEIYLPDGQEIKVTVDRQEQYDEKNQIKTLANGQPDYLETFCVNGKEVDTSEFKSIYQELIGVTIDGIVDSKDNVSNKAYARIEYHFNNGLDDLTVEYHAYKSLYYAVDRGDGFNFYSAKSKLDKALNSWIEFSK